MTAKFRTDRAARSGHHDDAVADAGVEKTCLGRHRIAAQKVAHIDFADVPERRIAGDQLLEFRDCLYMHAQGLQSAEDFPAAAPGQRRQREQNAVDVPVLDQERQLLR